MRLDHLRILLPVAIVLLMSVPVQAQRGGGRGGRVNKLSGPGEFWIFSGFYGFAIDSCDQPLCHPKTRRTWLNLTVSTADTADSNLREYPASVPDEDKQVRFWPIFDVAIEQKLLKKVPVIAGVGLGANQFSGPAFDTFYRLSITPTVSATLFELIDDAPWYLQAIEVGARANIYTQGFAAEDFGATPGTFEEDTDLTWEFFLSYDLFRFKP